MVRYLFTVLFFVLALPALAQQPSICRGKSSFDLGDGASGCLLGVGPTAITRGVRRDDGQSKSNRWDAGLIAVAVFGSYEERWSTLTPRMRKTCNLFRDALLAEPEMEGVRDIVVAMYWPEEPLPKYGARRMPNGDTAKTDAAALNRNCRAVNHF